MRRVCVVDVERTAIRGYARWMKRENPILAQVEAPSSGRFRRPRIERAPLIGTPGIAGVKLTGTADRTDVGIHGVRTGDPGDRR